MAIEVIRLEVIRIEVKPVLAREDPKWLKSLFGNFPSAIELVPERFPHIAEWPELDPRRQYGVAWSKGEYFENWAAVDQRLTCEGFGPKQRTFPPHLATEVVPRCDKLWPLRREGKCPAWIFASDSKAVWRYDDGSLGLPCVDVDPRCRGVRTGLVELGGHYGFLVACE